MIAPLNPPIDRRRRDGGHADAVLNQLHAKDGMVESGKEAFLKSVSQRPTAYLLTAVVLGIAVGILVKRSGGDR